MKHTYVTLVNLLHIFIVIASGVAAGFAVCRIAGKPWAIVGFVAGSIMGIVIMKCLSRYGQWAHPPDPVCICGALKYDVLEWLYKGTDEIAGTVNACTVCGRKYQSDFKLFMLISDDGHLVRYMKRGKLGRWQSDCDQASKSEPLSGV
jgi:hypothetical protein